MIFKHSEPFIYPSIWELHFTVMNSEGIVNYSDSHNLQKLNAIKTERSLKKFKTHTHRESSSAGTHSHPSPLTPPPPGQICYQTIWCVGVFIIFYQLTDMPYDIIANPHGKLKKKKASAPENYCARVCVCV